MTRAVVFAYHNVGVRCLEVLLTHGIDVPLVVTHEDNLAETIWFDSVARKANQRAIPVITPQDPNAPEVIARIAACKPDFLFSFYYRLMLKARLLALAPRGALNVHGSLLPKYRGRVPINWAVIHGETETGATLHYMAEKPDSGDVVAQSPVPILADDTAKDVFDKVTFVAAAMLDAVLPSLVAGTAPRTPQDLRKGSYFGGRGPEDGIIDWSRDAASIHNLVRAVAPPYPGARTTLGGRPARILRTRILDTTTHRVPALGVEDGAIVAYCGGGGTLAVLGLEVDGVSMTAGALITQCGPRPLPLVS
jgi:methionyl-tRNA formyltransferase